MSCSNPTHIYDPDRGWRFWNRDELATPGNEGHVPNIGDLVFDKDQGYFIVVDVDITTGVSTLSPWSPPLTPQPDPQVDVLIGAGPGYPSESFRIFLDTTVTPHTLSPDSRLRLYGSSVDYYKVFLGSDISEEHGVVVSSFFDPSGNFLGSSVPVETEIINGVPSLTVKSPLPGYSNRQMDNGELVTLVAYSVTGGVISIAQLVVVNTAAIRQHDSSKKYVQGITIESPFMSSADPQTIEFPINVTVESLPMTGVVHYSNGERWRLPIDNTKFTLMGMQNYVATVVGQVFDLVLSYVLSPDEISYNLVPTANGRLTAPFRAKTIAANGAYTVKLYVYPVWVNAQVGYRLEYWLYNLDRQTFYNVTPHIELGVNSAPFRPTEYGITQTVTVAIDLNKVDGQFAAYRHVQTFQIALLSSGNESNVNWSLYFTPDQETNYGHNLYADLELAATNYWNLRLANGFPSKEVWLRNLYEAIQPLYNEESEAEAPTPTHVRVVFLHNTYEISVEQWDDTLVVVNDLEDGELVYLQWIQRTPETDLQLGISALPARKRES